MSKKMYMACHDCGEYLEDIESSPEALTEFLRAHRRCSWFRLLHEQPGGKARRLIPVANLPFYCPDDLYVERLPDATRECDDCGAEITAKHYKGKERDYFHPQNNTMFDFNVCVSLSDEIRTCNKCPKCLADLLKRAEDKEKSDAGV